MLGVKYVTAPKEDADIFEQNNFLKVFEGEKFAVFENLTVLPRVFLASNYEGPPDVFGKEPQSADELGERDKQRRELIFNKLLSSDFDISTTIILEKPSTISPQFGLGSAQIISYKPDEVIIKTSSSEPKILFLSDNYFSGWKATIDGDETPVWRANYTFRAVPLVGGDHLVRFYYDNEIFKLALLISSGSVLMLILLLFGKS